MTETVSRPSRRSLESKRAKGRKCPVCRRPVLVGRDEGLRACVDVSPVDRAGEIKAIVAGLWTYSLILGGWLVHRDRDRAGQLGGTVHVEHRCVGGRR